MRDEDVIGLVVGIVIFAVAAAIYIGLIVLGVSIAKRKNRSPHWFWFAVHPVGLIITLIVMACLSPLKRCPNCSQTTQQYARLCGFCGYSYETQGAYLPPQQQGVYAPPPRY
jgi:ABC-type multidrug transport system permease subunit